MVTQSVVSRTVRDSAALLDAIIGPDPGAGYQGAPHDGSFAASLPERPGRLRIGYSSSSAINSHPDPEAVAAVEAAARLLTELGHEVEEVSPPHDDEALARDFLTIWFGQLHGQVSEVKRRLKSPDSHFEADTLASAELGRAAGMLPLLRSLGNVNDYIRALADFHASYDFFLTPTLAKPPVAIDSTTTPANLQKASRVIAKVRGGRLLTMSGVLDQLISDNLGWVPYTQLANLTGRPAISVQLHWTAAGLPLGVQFVGPLGSDGALLRLAAQLEEAQPWFGRYASLDPQLPR
ncbi:hypothetical protein BH10ACT10_BH10ACT10_03510 [soil metagenome]